VIDGKKEKSVCEMAPFDEALQDTSRRETVEDPYFLITMYRLLLFSRSACICAKARHLCQ